MNFSFTQKQINALLIFCVTLVCLNTVVLLVLLSNKSAQNTQAAVASKSMTSEEIAKTPAGKLERYDYTALDHGLFARVSDSALVITGGPTHPAEKEYVTTSHTKYLRETTKKDPAAFDKEMSAFVAAMRTAPGNYVSPRPYNTEKITADDLKAGDMLEILITSSGSNVATTVVVLQKQ